MPSSTPRLQPLTPETVPAELHADVGFTPGYPILNITATLAHHPKLAKRWMVFSRHVLMKSTLTPRDRELLILRTGYLCRAEYEWAHHVEIGRESGISEAEIQRVIEGPDAPGWSPFDRDLLRAADELFSDKRISDVTWNALSTRLDKQQLLDIVFTVGQYTLVSMALRTLGVQLEPGLPGWPEHVRQAIAP